MSKTTFNGIHIDLADISMIGKLAKSGQGWSAPVVWRQTGATINLNMATVKEEFAIIIGDEQLREERSAKENYERLVNEWKGSP